MVFLLLHKTSFALVCLISEIQTQKNVGMWPNPILKEILPERMPTSGQLGPLGGFRRSVKFALACKSDRKWDETCFFEIAGVIM